jgi:predicted lipoprotein
MRTFPLSLALILSLASGAPALALDNAAAKGVMERAVDGYIRPAYADFHARSKALVEATDALCKEPSEVWLKTVAERFSDTISSWSRIDFLREGPVMQENRLERVLFYPDRKSTGLKQVQALIAKPDESATDPLALKGRSVAMQGLGTFEYLFFGAYPESVASEKENFRCRYGLAIARNVESIAGELEAAWNAPDGISRDWKNPSADNPVYRDEAEAMQALIGLHVHGAEMVRDQRIKPFYKGRDAKRSPKAAVFWRSGNTARMIEGNIDGLEALWKVSDMGALLPKASQPLAQSIYFNYKAAGIAADQLTQPTADALKDEAYLKRLDYIEAALKLAINHVNGDIGAAVGLDAGFSFADGD